MKSLCLILLTFPCLLNAAEVPSQFTRQTTAGAVANLNQWWLNFHDEQLNQLISEAIAANPNLTAAVGRVREARARRLAAAADYFPQLSAKASGIRNQLSGNGRFAAGLPLHADNLFSSSMDASWEIDLFGRIRSTVAAAKAQEEASLAAQGNVMLSLIAELTSNYVELRGLQSQLNVLRENLTSQEKTLELTQSRLKAGLSPELVVAQSEAQLAITKGLPAHRGSCRCGRHASHRQPNRKTCRLVCSELGQCKTNPLWTSQRPRRAAFRTAPASS